MHRIYAASVVLVGLWLPMGNIAATHAGQSQTQRLGAQLGYMKKIAEVSWVTFERNSVYIGWRSRPTDIHAIVSAAAFQGNRAINFGVHVYNYDAGRFPTPDKGPLFFCTATVRHGKHQKNNC